MTGQTQSFALNEEPHQAAVGSRTFLFKPEIYTDEYLDAWAALRAVTATGTADEKDPAKIAEHNKRVNAATKHFLSELMLDDAAVEAAVKSDEVPDDAVGASAFLATKLPDRVLLELQRWILGVHGLRPTGPSSDSSEPASTEGPGDASIGSSLSAE